MKLATSVPKPRKKPLQRSAPKRKAAPRKVNRKRKASEFQRAYHSRARVLFVKGLPCIVCGMGPCDNAHIETGGMGRKADYDKIVPLCCMPMDHPDSPGYSRGHHGLFHSIGRKEFVLLYHRAPLDLDAEAAKCEAAWQEHSGGITKVEHKREDVSAKASFLSGDGK